MSLKISLKHLLFTLAVICQLTAFGQRPEEPEFVPGQLLIMLNEGASVEQALTELSVVNGQTTNIAVNREISGPMRVWLLEFDPSINAFAMLNRARNIKVLEMVQLNHIIKNRATPNDSEFGDQWQYINTGQSGGTPGADIDADLAWDITTGGVTPFGDTIVACVIDDGIDESHQDFGDNRWYNHAEIPGNNIDDDGNGYVDDYSGWDANNNNDDVDGGGHGTPVAGIVGAQGNNGTGVAGVNWDVKLMIVQGGGNEAQAIAAYTYPLVMRQRYNASNGAEGAFVVCTNASWGIDGGQPANAPLWCAMYDTLGKYGILSAGATANNNVDIDAVGDLPTACPSDYLITVTNMNDDDQKVTFAGYGTTTIDIGAFGADTWTTADNNGYGGFGGTSGATPHVCGTIALLYSAPCPSFAALAQTYPDSAALYAKRYIMDGGDPNASLVGITVSENRLNMYGALTELLNDCDTGACLKPFALGTANLIDTEVDLTWAGTAAVTNYTLQYREQGTSTWNTVNNASSPYNLTGLDACTVYEFQVDADCGGTGSSGFSNIMTFQTDGCCEAPSSLMVSNEANTSADIDWSSVLAAQAYDVRYREVGTTTWTTMAGQTGSSLNLTGLTECTEYEVQVATVCDTGVTLYTSSTLFSTKGCGACVDFTYCESNGADASLEWIASVAVNTLSNSSGSDNGYGDYTGMSTDLGLGNTYTIDLAPDFGGQSYDEYFTAYIDFNGDGDFDDANEQIFDAGSASANAVSGQFTIPATAATGITRLRVSMQWNNPAAACDQGFDYGEVEDYCVNIIDASSIEETTAFGGVSLYPNPANDNLTLHVDRLLTGQAVFTVLDATGREVINQNVAAQKTVINVNALAPGVYVFQLLDENGNSHAGQLMIAR